MGVQGLVSKEKIRGQYDGTCAPALPTVHKSTVSS